MVCLALNVGDPTVSSFCQFSDSILLAKFQELSFFFSESAATICLNRTDQLEFNL